MGDVWILAINGHTQAVHRDHESALAALEAIKQRKPEKWRPVGTSGDLWASPNVTSLAITPWPVIGL